MSRGLPSQRLQVLDQIVLRVGAEPECEHAIGSKPNRRGSTAGVATRPAVESCGTGPSHSGRR